jgi:long-subunit fatty acid transport protein
VITPLRVKGHHIVANISYNRNFDVYYEFGENIGGTWTGEEPNALFEKKGGVASINFGLGTRIYKELSFGFSANIYTGKVVSEERRYFYRYGLRPDYANEQYAHYEQYIRIMDSATYSGFNTKIGLLYATDKFRAGLVLNTPFNLKIESDSTIIRESTEEGLEVSTTIYNTEFYTETEYPYPKTAKIEIPMIIGLGLAYNVDDNWLVAADFEYKKFSGLKIHTLESFTYNSSSNLTEVFAKNVNIPNWSDVLQFRFGTEYLLNTSLGQIPLRAGFRREVFPQGNISAYEIVYSDNGEFVDVDDSEPSNVAKTNYLFHYDEDQVTGFSLSVGSGIYWSQILLDFAYTYTTYDQDIYEYNTEPRYKSSNEWKNHNINLTFTGYF